VRLLAQHSRECEHALFKLLKRPLLPLLWFAEARQKDDTLPTCVRHRGVDGALNAGV